MNESILKLALNRFSVKYTIAVIQNFKSYLLQSHFVDRPRGIAYAMTPGIFDQHRYNQFDSIAHKISLA